MKRTLAIALAIIIVLASATAAQEITLKYTFFGGWKYSTDGEKFKGVSMSGNELCTIMEGNDAALAEMKAYKKRKIWGAVCGWPGGILCGWGVGAGLRDDWTESDKIILGTGLGLMVITGLIEGSASRRLKKAVSIYNGEGQALLFDIDYRKSALSGNGQLTFALSYTF